MPVPRADQLCVLLFVDLKAMPHGPGIEENARLIDNARTITRVQDAQPAASKDMQVSGVFTLMIPEMPQRRPE